MTNVARRLVALLETRPVLVFLAGPNGAGKTTFFRTLLAPTLGDALPFINADEIAARLREAPSSSTKDAAELERLAFDKAQDLRESTLAEGLSFCTETVFSDTQGHKLDFLRRARDGGYTVFLVFIGLTDAQLSRARVIQRVAEGGHDVADEKLDARFPRTLSNLRSAIQEVDEAYILDNSDPDLEPYRPVAVYIGGRLELRADAVPEWAKSLPGLG